MRPQRGGTRAAEGGDSSGDMASQLHGVSFDPKRKRWKARIHFAGKERYIARFRTSREAALAYDQVARAINRAGDAAVGAPAPVHGGPPRSRRRPLNFPGTAHTHPEVEARLAGILALMGAAAGDRGGEGEEAQQGPLAQAGGGSTAEDGGGGGGGDGGSSSMDGDRALPLPVLAGPVQRAEEQGQAHDAGGGILDAADGGGSTCDDDWLLEEAELETAAAAAAAGAAAEAAAAGAAAEAAAAGAEPWAHLDATALEAAAAIAGGGGAPVHAMLQAQAMGELAGAAAFHGAHALLLLPEHAGAGAFADVTSAHLQQLPWAGHSLASAGQLHSLQHAPGAFAATAAAAAAAAVAPPAAVPASVALLEQQGSASLSEASADAAGSASTIMASRGAAPPPGGAAALPPPALPDAQPAEGQPVGAWAWPPGHGAPVALQSAAASEQPVMGGPAAEAHGAWPQAGLAQRQQQQQERQQQPQQQTAGHEHMLLQQRGHACPSNYQHQHNHQQQLAAGAFQAHPGASSANPPGVVAPDFLDSDELDELMDMINEGSRHSGSEAAAAPALDEHGMAVALQSLQPQPQQQQQQQQQQQLAPGPCAAAPSGLRMAHVLPPHQGISQHTGSSSSSRGNAACGPGPLAVMQGSCHHQLLQQQQQPALQRPKLLPLPLCLPGGVPIGMSALPAHRQPPHLSAIHSAAGHHRLHWMTPSAAPLPPAAAAAAAAAPVSAAPAGTPLPAGMFAALPCYADTLAAAAGCLHGVLDVRTAVLLHPQESTILQGVAAIAAAEAAKQQQQLQEQQHGGSVAAGRAVAGLLRHLAPAMLHFQAGSCLAPRSFVLAVLDHFQQAIAVLELLLAARGPGASSAAPVLAEWARGAGLSGSSDAAVNAAVTHLAGLLL